MNVNNTTGPVVVKVEDVPTIVVDDPEPTANVTGRRKRMNNKLNNKIIKNKKNNDIRKQYQSKLFQLAAKMKQVEDLEQKLKSILNAHEANSPRNVYLSIEKPKFSTTQVYHPLNFIEDLINYLDKLPERNRTIDTVVNCLEGDARNWGTIFKPRWNIIDDFMRDFLDQYWGKEDQSLLKNQILNGKWFWKDETMCRHFTCLVSQARWLKDKMSDEELVYEIMHHYPKHIQVAWALSKKNTVLEATEFLKKMDDIEVLSQGRKRMKQRQSMQMRYCREATGS